MREKAMSADDQIRSGSAAMKRQKESDEKLAQHSAQIGFPKSVSMRDDPMTKARAFLSEKPKLK